MKNLYLATHKCSLRLRGSCSIIGAMLFLLTANSGHAQEWLTWQVETEGRLTVTTVANSDPEEKDISVGDLNNDGFDDVIVVRKEPFSISTEGAKTDLLLINESGVLVDRTAQYAPGFISTPSFARDVVIADFNADGWQDVVVANTFDQQPIYYANLGNDGNGNWLGLQNQSASRFPVLNEDAILFCAVWAGDINGDGSDDLYFSNYKLGGGTSKDFLLINNGSGVFTNQSQTRLGNLRNSGFGTAVQIRDMDNDGDNDIIKVSTLFSVSPWNGLGVIIMFNNGTGNFTNWQNVAPHAPYMIEVADYTGDGLLDIFVVDDGNDYLIRNLGVNPNVSINFVREFVNNGSGGFGGNVHAADLDLDGDLDVIVSDVDVDIPPCNSSRKIHILRNDGGQFTQMYNSGFHAWATNSYDVGIIDINNDGLMDFISGKCSGYNVVMNNSCDIVPNTADYDEDGLPDACDPCPTNPDPACAPPTDYPVISTDLNIAEQWNEMLLASIRRDLARPPIHARNLFHISVAMWDIWATYHEGCTHMLGQDLNGFNIPFTPFTLPSDVEAATAEAISYASYRLLMHRFANSPQFILLQQAYNVHMTTLGYDVGNTSTNYSTGSAAAFGNYVAQQMIAFGLQDGSNEQNNYANTDYQPVNPPMSVEDSGNPTLLDFNRWQPLILQIFIDQSGNVIPGAQPPFLSPEWGRVDGFGLSFDDATTYFRDNILWDVFLDPGSPPLLSMDGTGVSDQYKWTFMTTLLWSSHLDPDDGVMWDISPGALGKRDLFPATFAEHPTFYNQQGGGIPGIGHALNPVTGQPYAPNMVPRGDYTRVLAEYWSDGPTSETPPGHWFKIFNDASNDPLMVKKIGGQGPIVSDLEWSVKGYIALGGATHDAAVSAWSIKGWYDYIRPISAIRGMAELGQSSNPGLPSYHPAGMPIIPGFSELVLAGDPLAGPANVNVNKMKVKSWKGHKSLNNIDVDNAGVGWILAENWEPFQRASFVTPPFAGYISGHSTFSRAAAEVLTALTGSEFFPGGIGEFTAEEGEYLVFENGPSMDVTLQWATYRDAANESGLSRIWGGIHPPADDIPGRMVGVMIGLDAYNKAELLWDNCSAPPPDVCSDAPNGLQASVGGSGVLLTWNPVPESVGCRVMGQRVGAASTQTQIDIPVALASQLFVPNSMLQPNKTFKWRVVCACSINPLVTTPFSPYNFFSTGSGIGFAPEDGAVNDVASDITLTIYPNPTEGIVNLYTNLTDYDVEVYDLMGRRVFHKVSLNSPNSLIDLSSLSSGAYYVTLRTENATETQRLIVH